MTKDMMLSNRGFNKIFQHMYAKRNEVIRMQPRQFTLKKQEEVDNTEV